MLMEQLKIIVNFVNVVGVFVKAKIKLCWMQMLTTVHGVLDLYLVQMMEFWSQHILVCYNCCPCMG